MLKSKVENNSSQQIKGKARTFPSLINEDKWLEDISCSIILNWQTSEQNGFRLFDQISWQLQIMWTSALEHERSYNYDNLRNNNKFTITL